MEICVQVHSELRRLPRDIKQIVVLYENLNDKIKKKTMY